MIKVENIDFWGFEHAMRGMWNSYNSWNKSDRKEAENLLDTFKEFMEVLKRM